MKFDGASFEPFVSGAKPTGAGPGLVTDCGDFTEPIEQLRERLISGWVNTLRAGAAKTGGKPASEEAIRSWDSFVRFVQHTPEGVLRKWNAEREKMWPSVKVTHADVQTAWKTAMQAALRVIFVLASNGGHAEPDHKVSTDELLASDGYKALNECARWAARYAVEHYQRQRADGSWFVSNRDEQGHLLADHISPNS